MAEIEKVENQKAPKQKKDSKLKKMWQGICKFFREVKAEFKKIVWFGKKQLINSTLVVLFFIAVISIIVSGLDLGFHYVLTKIGSLINL